MAKTKKVPKKIAGVKLPKPLRLALRDLAASQTGRTVLLEALAAAGAALAAAQPRSDAAAGKRARKPAADPSAGGDEPRAPAADARAATVAALEDAARAFTEALRRRGASPTPAQTPAAPSAAPAVAPASTTH